MWKSYLKIAIRNLVKNKGLTFINVFGLSIAFASSTLLFMNAKYELSFDTFFENNERIFKLYHFSKNQDGEQTSGSLAFPVIPTLKKECPEIEAATRFKNGGSSVEYDNKIINTQVDLVDADFFKVFSFGIIKGNKISPLQSEGDVVITEFAAKKIFGTVDPIGKAIKVDIEGVKKLMSVSAVANNFPDNSSITYDVLARIENHPDYAKRANDWNNSNHSGFIKLKENITQANFSNRLRAFQKQYNSSDTAYMKSRGFVADENGDYASLRILPLTDIHFKNHIGEGRTISEVNVYTILCISLLILLIASFNFVNLNIARAFTRTKEVGVRKSLGAQIKNIFVQIWSESFLICFVSILLGIGVAISLVPYFNQTFAAHLKVQHFFSLGSVVSVLAGLIIVSLIAGGYPAYTIARLGTTRILRGQAALKQSGGFRNSLIVTQFAIACALMICSIVAFKQFEHLRTYPLGFTKENVISIPVPYNTNGYDLMERLRKSTSSNPIIKYVSGSSINIGIGKDGGMSKWSNGFGYKDRSIFTNWMTVDPDYLKTMNIKLTKGRDFDRSFGDEGANLIVTESMANQFGTKDVIGLSFIRDSLSPKFTIVGVVPDVHMYSLHERMEPMTMEIATAANPNGIYYILIKTLSNDPVGTMQYVESVFKQILPGSEFKGSYLDENTNKLYTSEKKLSQLLGVFTVIAVILSCLGLFALSMLLIQQRVKEIGVRKVLGASVININLMLTKQFLKLVVIAIVIASPLAWYMMNKWLNDFPYRTSIDWWIFTLIAFLAIAISILSVSYHTIRAAFSNPVKSLRTE